MGIFHLRSGGRRGNRVGLFTREKMIILREQLVNNIKKSVHRTCADLAHISKTGVNKKIKTCLPN